MTRRHVASRRSRFSGRMHSLTERIRGHAPQTHRPSWQSVDFDVMAGCENKYIRKLAELAGEEQA